MYFLRQISALIGVLDAKGIDKVDVIANSEGGIYAMMAADLYPERFNNIIPCNTGGMIGDDSAPKLMYRFAADGLKSMIDILKRKDAMSPEAQTQIQEGVAGFNKFIMKSPRISYDEIKLMANTQIRDLMKEVHSKGIGISIIHTTDDGVFPMERIQNETKRKDSEEDLIVDGFYSIPGNHGEFSINPKKYTRYADLALEALEAKKEKMKKDTNLRA